MIRTRLYPQRWYDGFLGYFFRLAASGALPAGWFRDKLPPVSKRNKANGHFTLEVISHCWGYSNMLVYQLSSFVNHPPSKLSVVVTVFYAKEDKETFELLEYFKTLHPKNIRWNFQCLPKQELFRRGIGRNRAARSTQADWVWFTDCDIIFHENCLDSLAGQLQGKQETLYFPRHECTTLMLPQNDPILREGHQPQLVEIETEQFTQHSIDRAKGEFQIVHGDVARASGYCEGLSLYQTPSNHWRKCYEDRAFRWLIGSQGLPIDVEGVFQIRHIHKGRYKKGSFWSGVRSKIRRMQE